MSALAEGFREGREQRLAAVPNRKSLSRRLGQSLGSLAGTLAVKTRGLVLPVLGLGSITWGLWTVRPWAGMITMGISFFVLEWRADDE